jgi:uncharacterized membrane protein YeaQ/YmgE (transglycosylase-associated protein family)
MEIVVTLLIGAAAGWLASTIFYKGKGLGMVGNVVVGVIGSFVGSWLLGKLGIYLGTGWIGAIITGAIGALIVLALINLILKKR